MITKITPKNRNAYSILFNDARKALLESGKFAVDSDAYKKLSEANSITGLNDYFSYIGDLLDIDMKFAMLPVDENVFEIDADKRTITVPPAFTANGISVQSDEISEIVYFKVDRFYDATDLANQDVMVEWIAPSGLKGYSKPCVIDIDSNPGYIIFGWALASAITEQPGNVTFAVRFYRYDDTRAKIQYSLSTLTQTAVIRPNIGLDIPNLLKNESLEGYKVLGEEIVALIKERTENSNFSSTDVAKMPIIFAIDPEHVAYLTPVDSGKTDEEGNPITEYTVEIKASSYAPDTGDVTYFWKKFDYATGERIETESGKDFDSTRCKRDYVECTAKEAYEMLHPIVDPENPINFKFYEKNSEAEEDLLSAYEEYDMNKAVAKMESEGMTQEEILAALDQVTLYYFGSSAKLNGVGFYVLTSKNRVGTATASVDSEAIIVFPPATPVIKDGEAGFPERVILIDEEGKDVEAKEIAVGFSTPSEPDIPCGYSKYKTEEGEINSKYAFNPSKETQRFTWYYSETEDGEFDVDVASADDDTFEATNEGFYKCGVVGLLNGEETDEVMTRVCRVTKSPSLPVVTIAGLASNDAAVSLANDPELVIDEDALKAENYNRNAHVIHTAGNKKPLEVTYASLENRSDKVSYQWYEYTLEKGDDLYDDDALQAHKGVYTPQEKFTLTTLPDRLIEGATESTYMPKTDGWYFCIVTNTYNEMEKAASSCIAYFDAKEEKE